MQLNFYYFFFYFTDRLFFFSSSGPGGVRCGHSLDYVYFLDLDYSGCVHGGVQRWGDKELGRL